MRERRRNGEARGFAWQVFHGVGALAGTVWG